MRKLIFVDVDGVLNPEIPGSDFQHYKILGFNVFLSKKHGRWLLKLAEKAEAELVWGTSWQELANEHIGPKIGLPELPYLDLRSRKFSETLDSVKGRQAVKYANGDRFVYFDDLEGLKYHITDSEGVHILVNPYLGLTSQDMGDAEDILTFDKFYQDLDSDTMKE